jgi:hypothetical protein
MYLYHFIIDLDAQGGAGARGRSQLDDKTRPWASFAQRCVTTDAFDGGALTQADVTELALSLAKQTPYVISCEAMRVQVSAQSFVDDLHD